MTDRYSGPTQPASVVPDAQLQQIAYLVDNLKDTQNTALIEQKLRQLDELVQRFRAEAGLQGQDEEVLEAAPNLGLAGKNFVPTMPF